MGERPSTPIAGSLLLVSLLLVASLVAALLKRHVQVVAARQYVIAGLKVDGDALVLHDKRQLPGFEDIESPPSRLGAQLMGYWNLEAAYRSLVQPQANGPSGLAFTLDHGSSFLPYRLPSPIQPP